MIKRAENEIHQGSQCLDWLFLFCHNDRNCDSPTVLTNAFVLGIVSLS